MDNNKTKQRNWMGLVLVVLGLVFLLRNLHLLSLPSVFFSWKALLIVIGVIGISLGRKEGFIPLMIGALFIFIYDILGLSYFSFGELWPLGLVLVGIALLMRHRKSNLTADANSPEIDGMAIFSGIEKKVTSQEFAGGKATAIFGGIDIDMRSASLSPNSNVIDLLTLFGGSSFKVPSDWTVNVSQLTVVLGAFEDHRIIDKSQTDPNKVLHIKGIILFGGGEIKNA
jgi:predicted membrane protein